MDAGYRITVCREQIRDYDLPSLQQTLQHYLGIDSREFRNALQVADALSFDIKSSVDKLQECLFQLEEYGFRVNAEKLPGDHRVNSCSVEAPALVYPNGFASLSEDDCRILLYSSPKGVRRAAKYKNAVTFGCCFAVISCYLLIIYSSFQ